MNDTMNGPSLLWILIAAFVGTIVGNGAREYAQVQAMHPDEMEHEEVLVTAVLTHTLLATLLATLLGRRLLLAFLAGAGLSAATGAEPDRRVQALLRN